MKNKYRIYIALFILICLFPSAGLLLSGVEKSSENRETAKAPVLMNEEGINVHVLSDAGAWFEDHFAFRNECVTGYALLLGKLFGVSAQTGVITGTDGWLFYKDSLEDFQGIGQMTQRQLFDVAHTMAMIQEYANNNGAEFAFMIAPNKNSLYREYMPYYYQPFRTNKSNRERLKPYLQAERVNYIDLYERLRSENEILYHKRDSHWNNEGAAMAADEILTCMGLEHPSYADRSCTVRKDFQGDLDRMLYPAAIENEEEIYYEPSPQFAYCEKTQSNFDPKISTRSNGTGSLVMYRDSFGNALLPYLAEVFEQAYFSRALPYQMQDLTTRQADTLLIERAERFLPDMAKEAPYMEAPAVNPAVDGTIVEPVDLQIVNQGEYTKVTGNIPASQLTTNSRIFVKIGEDLCYEAFPVSPADDQEGFSLLLPADICPTQGSAITIILSESRFAGRRTTEE